MALHVDEMELKGKVHDVGEILEGMRWPIT